MKNKLVVRDSYVKMKDEIVKWLSNRVLSTGLLVVTGTPGTGKSAFLAFVAAYFAEENKRPIAFSVGADGGRDLLEAKR